MLGGIMKLYVLSSPHMTSQQLLKVSFIILLILQMRQTQNTDNWSPSLHSDCSSPVLSLSKILPTMLFYCVLSHTQGKICPSSGAGERALDENQENWDGSSQLPLSSGMTLDKSVNLLSFMFSHLWYQNNGYQHGWKIHAPRELKKKNLAMALLSLNWIGISVGETSTSLLFNNTPSNCNVQELRITG